MYVPLDRLPAETVRACVGLVEYFDILRGSGQSRMSGRLEAEERFRPVLEPRFPGPWRWTTVVALYPSCQIAAHQDAEIRPAQRYHLPLLVNPGCWSFSDGTWQQLEVGRVYEIDPSLTHGAVNWGSSTRVHLIVDCEGVHA